MLPNKMIVLMKFCDNNIRAEKKMSRCSLMSHERKHCVLFPSLSSHTFVSVSFVHDKKTNWHLRELLFFLTPLCHGETGNVCKPFLFLLTQTEPITVLAHADNWDVFVGN